MSEAHSSDRTARLFENISVVMESQRQRRNDNGHTVNPRDRLFHALFMKVGLVYSRYVPKRCRILLELLVLIQGIFLFSLLSYLHFSFGRSPVNCIDGNNTWPKDGVLQVRIQHQISLKKAIPRFYSNKEHQVLFHPCHNGNINSPSLCRDMAANLKQYYDYYNSEFNKSNKCYQMNLSDFLITQNERQYKKFQHYEYIVTDFDGEILDGYQYGDIVGESALLTFYEKYLAANDEDRQYVFEYAKEFGFLRLSHETRKRLKIPVKVVTLDPQREKCFGDLLSRLVWKYFLGYDEILMSSMKKIADMENNSGYMLNVVTGDHYKFVSWGIGRGSYFISLVLMFLFTVSISTLLRYCHQQVFFFIIRMLQMMDSNIMLAFPIAPLFTVVLSLVGMETIMSEYFNDTTTSFYIILIVWAVDQFDTICCHTTTSQKYWLRFFYLYHFIFYAYHYRFNGQYSSLALAATWFLIQHSMLYFFHNYELPAIENHVTGNGRRDEETYLDEAVQIIVEGIEMVVGQQNTTAANNSTNNEEAEPHDRPPNDSPQRIFVFAIDRPIIQMFREFIRQFRERLNLQRLEENEHGDTGIIIQQNINHEDSDNISMENNITQSDLIQDLNNDTDNLQITEENSFEHVIARWTNDTETTNDIETVENIDIQSDTNQINSMEKSDSESIGFNKSNKQLDCVSQITPECSSGDGFNSEKTSIDDGSSIKTSVNKKVDEKEANSSSLNM